MTTALDLWKRRVLCSWYGYKPQGAWGRCKWCNRFASEHKNYWREATKPQGPA